MKLMLLLPPLAFLASASLLSWLLRTGRAIALALDRPNHRSLHQIPKPRVGGLGIMAGALFALVVMGQLLLAFLVLMLLVVSWLDDRGGVAIHLRLLVHVAAALMWVGWTSFGLPVVLAVISIVWMTNLYNFMDGSDGLAGGMAVAGFGSYGLAAWMGGNHEMCLMSLSIAASALGFLRFNFPPARIFMGDAGSIPLGFMAGALGYRGWSEDLWAFWFPLLVFSPFVADATLTLLRRIFRGDRFWRAHRDHYYQRLVRMGWNHRKTALAGYSLMLFSGASALALLATPSVLQFSGVLCWAAVYAVLARRIDSAWSRER